MNEQFEHYIVTEKAEFKYAVGKPAVSGREFHDNDEILWFLGGEAQFVSKNVQCRLVPGMIVFIPREQFHQFKVASPDTYWRCVLGFSPDTSLNDLAREVLREVEIFEHPTETTAAVFRALMSASQTPLTDADKTVLLQSAVAQILMQRKLSHADPILPYATVSSVTQQALAFMDLHYAEELTLERIAAAINISVSSLSHHFRRDLGLSVYRYLCEKRLSAVRQKVQQGMSLTDAAARCGFKDYSGFFRLYKSRFGQSPSSSK